jgi:hypothetical protein
VGKRRAEGSAMGGSDGPRKRVQTEQPPASVPPQSSFGLSNRRAQQRSRELAAQGGDRVQEITEALSWAKFQCLPCHITGSENEPRHSLEKCPAIQRLGGFGQLFDDRKEAVTYSWHHFICFSCHIPVTGGLHEGGFTTRTANNCGDDKDIIWPAVWAILRTDAVRAEAEVHFGSRWASWANFDFWNNDQEAVKQYGTGLLAIFLWYYNAYCI